MDTENIPCKAAFSQTDITPDFPVEMIGCYRADNRPDGVLHPLMAQVLLFEHCAERFCLVAIDSLGLTTGLSSQLRTLVAEALGTRPGNVMLTFSHAHSAPAPLSPLNGERYYALLCERVVACAAEAATALQPCMVAWTVGETDIGENRRAGCSAVDSRLGALQVVHAATGRPIAVLLRVCAHANILMTHSQKLSSDYFGASREKLGAHFGCPVMLVQGAAGNIKPVCVDKISGGGPEDVERVSDMLLRSAVQLHFEPRAVTCLRMVEKQMDMVSDVPQAEEAQRIVRASGMDAPGWLAECARLRNDGIAAQTQTNLIHFLFINEGCLCGVPDEIFCELALSVAEQSGCPLLFFNGYTNGCTGYLPHAAEWVKGGYETHDSYLFYYAVHGHVMPFRADTAERLVSAVLEGWKQR